MGLLFSPKHAQAYLIDANDATTVDPGAVELELQLVGMFFEQGDDGYAVLPSIMGYVGIAKPLDLIFLGRGYLSVTGGGFSFADTQLLLRYQLREGSYDGEDAGPSLVLQGGALLPTFNDVEGIGASLALLLSHSFDSGTIHANAQVDYRHGGNFAFFGTFVFEGPPSWNARPCIEVFVDVEQNSGTEVSGLLGVTADISERAAVMTGVRVARGVDANLISEGRLSLWVHLGRP